MLPLLFPLFILPPFCRKMSGLPEVLHLWSFLKGEPI